MEDKKGICGLVLPVIYRKEEKAERSEPDPAPIIGLASNILPSDIHWMLTFDFD